MKHECETMIMLNTDLHLYKPVGICDNLWKKNERTLRGITPKEIKAFNQ